jgi:AcrR family transcriptional regulator
VSTSKKARETYRHGDLRRALLEAAIDLARAGGPAAVVLREATRQVGVSPNAAYRHFANRDDLLAAVQAEALSQVARTMEVALAGVDASLPPADLVLARFGAVGAGYLQFAFSEPGLFRTAFAFYQTPEDDADPAKTGQSGLNAFQLLSAALDEMVGAGLMDQASRPGAEFLAWSAVHGLAMLVLEGPLRSLPAEQVAALGARLVTMVQAGLSPTSWGISHAAETPPAFPGS